MDFSVLALIAVCFGLDYDSLRFPIDVRDCHRPEGNQIDCGHKLGKDRRQKLPVLAEEVDQRSSNSEVQRISRRRLSALHKYGEKDELESVRKDRQYHRDSKACHLRDSDCFELHM